MALGRGRDRHRERTHQTNNTTVRTDTVNPYVGMSELNTFYYNKQVGDNETHIQFDINESSHLQNFLEIKDLPIYEETQIPTTGGIEDIKGSGYIDLPIKPTIGDVFIANIGSDFLFSINSVKRVSYNNSNLHHVTYSAIEQIDTLEKMNDYKARLKTGTIETLIYDSEAIQKDTAPLLLESVFVKLGEIRALVYMTERVLAHKIASIGLQPMGDFKDTPIFDPNLISFIDYVFDFSTLPITLNMSSGKILLEKENTIFDALLFGEKIYSKNRALYYSHGLEYSEIDAGVSIDFTEQWVGFNEFPQIDTNNKFVNKPPFMFELDAGKIDGDEYLPDLFGETYILSPTFYGIDYLPRVKVKDEDPDEFTPEVKPLSKLEEEINRYFNDEKPDLDNIIDLLRLVNTIDFTRQLYFGSIILFIAGNALLTRTTGYRGVQKELRWKSIRWDYQEGLL